MLATAVDALPTGPGWAYEFKWDGVRTLLDVADARVRLVSRAGNDVTGGYPELVAPARDLGDVLLDGEIVAFVDGRPSFERLQSRMHVRGKTDVARLAASAPVTYVVFDVLRRAGVDLTPRPYTERRATLERIAEAHPGATISPSFDDAAAVEQVAREHGLEGVVAKRLDSRYRPGQRSDDWRKLRFVRAGDFAVIGWEAADDLARVPSSLLLGVADGAGFRFAGKVGSGLSGTEARALRARLTDRATPAVDRVPRSVGGRRSRWVEPEVVVQVRFTDWTGDGRLRQPVFERIREDKSVQEAHGDG